MNAFPRNIAIFLSFSLLTLTVFVIFMDQSVAPYGSTVWSFLEKHVFFTGLIGRGILSGLLIAVAIEFFSRLFSGDSVIGNFWKLADLCRFKNVYGRIRNAAVESSRTVRGYSRHLFWWMCWLAGWLAIWALLILFFIVLSVSVAGYCFIFGIIGAGLVIFRLSASLDWKHWNVTFWAYWRILIMFAIPGPWMAYDTGNASWLSIPRFYEKLFFLLASTFNPQTYRDIANSDVMFMGFNYLFPIGVLLWSWVLAAVIFRLWRSYFQGFSIESPRSS